MENEKGRKNNQEVDFDGANLSEYAGNKLVDFCYVLDFCYMLMEDTVSIKSNGNEYSEHGKEILFRCLTQYSMLNLKGQISQTLDDAYMDLINEKNRAGRKMEAF